MVSQSHTLNIFPSVSDFDLKSPKIETLLLCEVGLYYCEGTWNMNIWMTLSLNLDNINSGKHLSMFEIPFEIIVITQSWPQICLKVVENDSYTSC